MINNNYIVILNKKALNKQARNNLIPYLIER